MVGLITKNILKILEYLKKLTSLPVLKFLFLIWKRSTLDSFNCGGWACRDCTTPQSGALGIFSPTLDENFISVCNSYVSSCLQRGKYDNVISGSFILFNSKLYPTFVVKLYTGWLLDFVLSIKDAEESKLHKWKQCG